MTLGLEVPVPDKGWLIIKDINNYRNCHRWKMMRSRGHRGWYKASQYRHPILHLKICNIRPKKSMKNEVKSTRKKARKEKFMRLGPTPSPEWQSGKVTKRFETPWTRYPSYPTNGTSFHWSVECEMHLVSYNIHMKQYLEKIYRHPYCMSPVRLVVWGGGSLYWKLKVQLFASSQMEESCVEI